MGRAMRPASAADHKFVLRKSVLQLPAHFPGTAGFQARTPMGRRMGRAMLYASAADHKSALRKNVLQLPAHFPGTAGFQARRVSLDLETHLDHDADDLAFGGRDVAVIDLE